MEEPNPKFRTALFEDASFTFPDIDEEAPRIKVGAYNPLLDAIFIDTSATNLTIKTRVGHEVAHRLLSLNGLNIRLTRHVAGCLYCNISYFLGAINKYQAQVSDLHQTGGRVKCNSNQDEAIIAINSALFTIRQLQNLLDACMDSIQVVYELIAIEFGIRLLDGHIDAFLLDSIEKILVSAESKRAAPVMYRTAPSYYIENHFCLDVPEERKRIISFAEFQTMLFEWMKKRRDSNFPKFPDFRSLYEQSFIEQYYQYKNELSHALKERVRLPPYRIDTPLSFIRDENNRLKVYDSRTVPSLKGELLRKANTIGTEGYERELSDVWRITQVLEFEVSKLSDPYRLPLQMMKILDFLLFNEHGERWFDDDYGKDAVEEINWRDLYIPGESVRSYRSFMTFLSDDTSSFSLNENYRIQGERLGLSGDWWRWLLLYETIRIAIKKGGLIYCPLKGCNASCPPDCPLKTNLQFLAEHSDMVATPFCQE